MSDAPLSREQVDRLRHDLRSPLVVISGFARLLAGDGELSDEDRRGYARRIEDAAADLRRAVDEGLR